MNGRGVGVTETLHGALPDLVREAFTLVTQLGDAWFLIAAIALCYWFGDRRRGAFAVAAMLGALALTLALKGLFALPRPPSEFHVGYADGYGFPSGHAIGVTVGWTLLVELHERWTRRTRATVAGVVIAAVAASRLVIGVHYLVDVVVGVAVGLGYLLALQRATDWSPRGGFAVAAAIALAALATNGPTHDAVAVVAGTLAGGAAWLALDGSPEGDVAPDGNVSPPVALVALVGLGGLGYAGNSLDLPLVAIVVLNAAVSVVVLVLPAVVERVSRSTTASPT